MSGRKVIFLLSIKSNYIVIIFLHKKVETMGSTNKQTLCRSYKIIYIYDKNLVLKRQMNCICYICFALKIIFLREYYFKSF